MINLNSLCELPSFLCSTKKLKNKNLQCEVDNRKISKQSLFIAIVGKKFNPLVHLEMVVKSGCKYVVYEKNEANDALVSEYHGQLTFIEVSNVFNFIQELGKRIACDFKKNDGQIIAISGSNGKTTTKEMLSFILSKLAGEEKVIYTQKNNNNHIGVPFTLFQINNETKYAVVELGSNHPGEIETLCKMLNPQTGVTTNIGDTHLEFFGTREKVFEEEAILRFYCKDHFYCNYDDEQLKNINDVHNLVYYGESSKINPFIFGSHEISVGDTKIQNKNIIGKHNFINLGVAFLIAKNFNFDLSKTAQAASEFVPTQNRSEWKKWQNAEVFLDAYNANPSSMRAAIEGFYDHLGSIGADLEKSCLLLGDMNELGSAAENFHRELGEFVASKGVQHVIFVGRYAQSYQDGFKEKAQIYFDPEISHDEIQKEIEKYDYILIKASRSLQLEAILDIK